MLPFSEKLAFLAETLLECSAIPVPLWMAVLVGLLVGWMWGFKSNFSTVCGLRRTRSGSSTSIEHGSQEGGLAMSNQESVGTGLNGSAIEVEDLQQFYLKLHHKDGGPPWEFLMEHSIPGMTYQAWRRDPQEGPTEYRSRQVFENATPEILRDFFLDDEFRHEWDDLIKSAYCLEGCKETGESVAHWVKKFPFFCSNREYVISRRIFECRGVFFCITKAVSHLAVPIKKRPRRVDVYTSCWCIQADESSESGACEVTFVHSEDMLIQRDLAKIGVRRGIWPLVKKMEPGLRKYQAHRGSSSTMSFSASMAQLVTSIPALNFEQSETSMLLSQIEGPVKIVKQRHAICWKWAVIGGAVILACAFKRGAVVLGAAKRLRKQGKRT